MATYLFGDCIPVMKSLPDNSVDCFVCDLPYGQLAGPKIGGQANVRLDKDRCAWDVPINLEEFWTQVKRLCKDSHTPVLMFCNTKFGYELIKSNEKWFRYDLVWDKGHGVSFLLANKMPMKSHEMIYVFSKAGAFYNRVDVKTDKGTWSESGIKNSVQYGVTPYLVKNKGGEGGMRCPLSVIPYNGRSVGTHPTEKPKELYEWLLRRYVPKGGTVLDPTAGSFNSVTVAKSLGYKAIGIEKDRGFFYKAIANETARN
jgi:site-specific DNA-methyltransferase (adenine-specific)